MKLTIPTWLTLARIALIPVLVIVYYLDYRWTNVAATAIFVFASLTDWLDGWIARRYNQFSAFGAFLDPVADKLMVAVALVITVQYHHTIWMALWASVIIGREIAVSALREWMAELGQRAKVAVAAVGKIKTIVQMVALGFLLYREPLLGFPIFLIGEWLLRTLSGAAGGAIGLITSTIIFLYVLISLLVNKAKLITLIRRLNPLGEEVTDLYLAKMGAMVKGTVKGQFIIALIQGILGATSIYIAGFHDAFFIFAIFLTALSVIPLGSGIVTIPFGIGMALFGNIAGGVFVVLFHLIGITNVDNFLRPILVPKEARLDPALMLLSVFSGIAMFGFFGIILGPVLMILIVTTISVYLAVYKGVEMKEEEEDEERKPRFRRKRTPEAAKPIAP